jgi:hypothetical protein
MFRRVDTENLVDTTSYAKSENYLKTLKLYRQSYRLELQGDVEGFTDTYLQAIRLQRAEQVCLSFVLFFCFIFILLLFIFFFYLFIYFFML